MTVDLHSGDAVKWAREYTGAPFHALLCDAPYEMNFMSKGWDASGVSFNPETWEAFSRVLHPGAFLFVFAGTINDDLISVAMREAGLRKFHKMMGWGYGSGFPKASRSERDAGLDGMPLQEPRPLGISQWEGQTNGSGETMGKSSPARNPHPTVKPLALARYLATLLLPPAEYAPRRLFVPFAGVASEVIGAMQAGWDEVEGVELTEEYMPIAQARVDYWMNKERQVERQLSMLEGE